MIKKLLLLLVLIPTIGLASEKDQSLEAIIKGLNALNSASIASVLPTVITIDTPLTFMGADNQGWEAIIQGLATLKSGDVVTFNVTGFGGEVIEGNRVVNAIVEAEKRGVTVNMDVVGPAYSMHAYITLFADKVILESNGGLMFHEMSSQETFLRLIPYRVTSLDPASRQLEIYFLHQGLLTQRLTKEDVDAILDGKDVYKTRYLDRIRTDIVEDDLGAINVIESILILLLKIVSAVIVVGLLKRVYNKARG